MKKLLLLIVTLIAVTTYAQKAEYKAAYKAFDKGNIIDAKELINKACQQKDEADGKLKSKIIFLKAKIYADLGDVNYDNYVISVKSIDELINFEKQIHKNRYRKIFYRQLFYFVQTCTYRIEILLSTLSRLPISNFLCSLL